MRNVEGHTVKMMQTSAKFSHHYGRDAHLEVFNETTKKQIAVSHIEKIDFFRNLTNAEKGRVLLFDKGK